MKILMLSIDQKIFEAGSAVRARMVEYGTLAEELHIVVYTPPGFKIEKLAENVIAYPTNCSRLTYFWHGYGVCGRILPEVSPRATLRASGKWLVTSQDAFTNVLALLLRVQFRFAFEVQIHTDFLSPYFIRESLKNRVRSWLYLYSTKRANSVRVVSQRIADSLIVKGISREKINILPVFVDIEKIKNTPITVDLHKKYPQFEKIILMVSRLSREKNIDLAIEAMAEVVKTHPKVNLAIVGDGPERDNLKLKIENSKLKKHVILEGWQNDVVSYYKTADVFLNTSHYEGYGMSMVEARVAGLPVISTDVGIAKEIGAYIVVGNVEAIVQVLETCLREKAYTNGGFVTLSFSEYLLQLKNIWTKI